MTFPLLSSGTRKVCINKLKMDIVWISDIFQGPRRKSRSDHLQIPTYSSQIRQPQTVAMFLSRPVRQMRLMIYIRGYRNRPSSRLQLADLASGSHSPQLNHQLLLRMIPSALVIVMTKRRRGLRRTSLTRQSGFKERRPKQWQNRLGTTMKRNLTQKKEQALRHRIVASALMCSLAAEYCQRRPNVSSSFLTMFMTPKTRGLSGQVPFGNSVSSKYTNI